MIGWEHAALVLVNLVPTIVQGTRDTLGSAEDIAGYDLSSSIRIHYLEDGDHSFKPRARSGRTLAQNLTEGLDAIDTFLQTLSP